MIPHQAERTPPVSPFFGYLKFEFTRTPRRLMAKLEQGTDVEITTSSSGGRSKHILTQVDGSAAPLAARSCRTRRARRGRCGRACSSSKRVWCRALEAYRIAPWSMLAASAPSPPSLVSAVRGGLGAPASARGSRLCLPRGGYPLRSTPSVPRQDRPSAGDPLRPKSAKRGHRGGTESESNPLCRQGRGPTRPQRGV